MKPVAITMFSLAIAATTWLTPQATQIAQQQFSDQCITPFSFCFLPELFPVGTPCFCPDGSGGIVQF